MDRPQPDGNDRSVSHTAFPRPRTFANVLVDFLIQRFVAAPVSRNEIRQWQADSMRVFSSMGVPQSTIVKVLSDCTWTISDAKPPRDVWCAEAKFLAGSPPIVIWYTDTVATRLPSRRIRRLVGQSGADHLFGHLLPYCAGASDYGEEVACVLQQRAAWARRSIIWKIIAAGIPFMYILHKRIALATYFRKGALWFEKVRAPL